MCRVARTVWWAYFWFFIWSTADILVKGVFSYYPRRVLNLKLSHAPQGSREDFLKIVRAFGDFFELGLWRKHVIHEKMTQLEYWTCARTSRDPLEGLKRTGKVILRESALERREFRQFKSRTSYNGRIKNWSIVLWIQSNSFQTNCRQRPRSATDGLFYYSWWNHILYDSRR